MISTNTIPGGLLQMIAVGKQDNFLTNNPEITFFKRIYKRYTNFSTELQEIYPEQNPEFNSSITFNLSNCDLINKCYLVIDLPIIQFTDSYITNETYILNKNNKLKSLTLAYNLNIELYNNLKNYVNIQIKLYTELRNALMIDTITLNQLQNIVLTFNTNNKNDIFNYINKIEDKIINEINISSYILSLISFEIITREVILDTLNKIHTIMIYYLEKLNKKIISIGNTIDELDYINFSLAEYLGHQFFTSVELNIGGQIVTKYSNDIFHINQLHSIKENEMDTYLNLIGHYPDNIQINSKPKGGKKIIIPLSFWFNKDYGSSLPILSLQYSKISINVNINNVNKIINFTDFEYNYDKLLLVSIPFDEINKVIINKNLLYFEYKIDYNNKVITYYCIVINNELLKYQIPELTNIERNNILEENGIKYSYLELEKKYENYKRIYNYNYNYDLSYIVEKNDQYIIEKIQWIKMSLNITEKKVLSNVYSKIYPYYPYIDFNIYYNSISCPPIKLVTESIFLEEYERNKFSLGTLEYIGEMFKEYIYKIPNQLYYDCELGIDTLTKELYWYIQPDILNYGISNYNKNQSLTFYYKNYISDNNIVEEQELIFNKNSALSVTENNYFQYLLSYKYLNNILPNGVYYKPFCLYPEESQPSGTINLQNFIENRYYLKMNKNFIDEYTSAISYLFDATEFTNNLTLKFISKYYDFIQISKGKIIF